MNKIKHILGLFGIYLLISPVIVIFIIFFTYNEFGVMINLYKSKDCAYINESCSYDYWNPSCPGLCQLYGHTVSTHLFNQKSLEEALNYVINVVPKREATEENNNSLEEKIKDYPKNPSDWVCALNGRIIEDNKKEKVWLRLTQQQIQYKCWPAEKSQ